MSRLFVSGAFQLHSGQYAFWKVDCDALTPADWQTLATMLAAVLPPFGAVEGVPRGGLPFAVALQQYATAGPLLIVDDVLTTGASLERHRRGRDAIGGVVFARGPAPNWVTSLWMFTRQPSMPAIERLRALLLRLRGWDMMDANKGDGDYWRSEIDAAIAASDYEARS